MKYIFSFLLSLLTVVTSAQTAAKKDSVAISNTIINFYKWYTANYQKLEAFHLYKGKRNKNVPPYIIDWKEAGRYFTFLRNKVPYVGEDFIAWEKNHFLDADAMFKKEPSEEMPAGFDYDRFTNSQEEPKWFLKELVGKKTRQWKIDVNGNQANVAVFVTDKKDGREDESWKLFCGQMKKVNKQWKIAALNCGEE